MWTKFVNWIKGLFGYVEKEVSYVEPYWVTGEKVVEKTVEDIAREVQVVEQEVVTTIKRKTAKRTPKTKANTANIVANSFSTP